MKIGNVKLKSNIMLAPMAGYTDVGFRHLACKYNAGLTVTEMISAKGLCYGSEKTLKLLATNPSEKPVAVQIFGSEPEFIAKAVKHDALKKFDIIDINMGCPVPKIVKNGDGSALMREPSKVYDVVSSAVENANRPVTVKIRSGFDFEHINAVEIAKTAEKAGASAVTVHGRTREQMYSGKADWNIIKQVKENITIPVIGNGDIVTRDDYLNIMEQTGCDGVMIGRGALGRPYIFSELQNIPYEFKVKEAIHSHINDLLKIYDERTVANLMKTHICYYAKNLSCLKKVRKDINFTKNLTEMYDIIAKYF